MGFPEGFPLFKANIFFLKLKNVQQFKKFNKNLIFHVSNLNVRELDPPTNLRQLDTTVARFYM